MSNTARRFKNAFILIGLTGVMTGSFLVPTAQAQVGSGMKPATRTPKTTTVEGILVDSKCYEKSIALHMPHPNVGVDHMTPNGEVKGCAIKCARMGIPVAVLEDNGTLLILAAPSRAFAADMARRVRVTGMTPFAGSIVPAKVEVQAADGTWKEIKFSTMM